METTKKDIFKETIEGYKKKLNDNTDVVVKVFNAKESRIGLVYLKSMINEQLFVLGLMTPIINAPEKITIKSLEEDVLKLLDVTVGQTETEVLEKVLKNEVVVFVEGESGFASAAIESFLTRNPDEPPTSPVILGPREGFTESIKTNIQLIRRRFKTENLVFKDLSVGVSTQTRVSLCFLKNIANESIVKKIEKKINQIDIDGIIDSYYLIAFLEERPNSIFKQVGSSEKPDIIAAKMLEGRVAILVDGSPIVLTLPFMVIEDLQNSNDYYTNAFYATFIRYIRAIGILVASVIPSVFLSLRLYHYKVMPIQYLITIASSSQGLPFTPFIEILFILLLFQILYEVSLRLPSYLGLATSIVGALILGDTGVKAGLISPPGVVIVALSIISIYVAPDQAPQLTLLRAIFIVVGGIVGILGVVGGMIFFINYMATLDSYGTPYLAPYAPKINSDAKDSLIKVPINRMKTRPEALHPKNKLRFRK